MTRNDVTARQAEGIKRWLSIHAAGTYETLENRAGSEYSLTVSPHNPSACRISYASKDGSSQFNLGEQIFFDEVDGLSADRNSNLTSELSDGELDMLLDAVVNGRVKEVFFLKADQEIGREGHVWIGEKKYWYRSRRLWNLFSRADSTRVVQYAPYKQTPARSPSLPEELQGRTEPSILIQPDTKQEWS